MSCLCNLKMKPLALVLIQGFICFSSSTSIVSAAVIDFEDVGTPLVAESYWNGSDSSGGFSSGGLSFNNNYNASWGSWDGWAYSNTTDNATPGFNNQYSAYPGSGNNSSATYGVAFQGLAQLPTISGIPAGQLQGVYVTNTTYPGLSMTNGDAFAKKFGGSSGDDPDWFLLTITGKNDADLPVGTVDFYLADYRNTDNSLDYIIDEWTLIDLTPLGSAQATTLEFELTSSDVGAWGMNTPGYFALDDLVFASSVTQEVPEPSTIILMLIGFASLLLRARCRAETPGRNAA